MNRSVFRVSTGTLLKMRLTTCLGMESIFQFAGAKRWEAAPRFGTIPGGEVSEWLKVPLSKSGVVTSHRGFESRPLRLNGGARI